MTKEKHSYERLVERFGRWQRKLRDIVSLVPARRLPLLTPAEAFGPEMDRFRDPGRALVAWRDKQSQHWRFRGSLSTSTGRGFAYQLSFFNRHTQNDFIGVLPARLFSRQVFAAHFAITDPMNAESVRSFQYWQQGSQSLWSGFADDRRLHVEIGGWHAYRRDDGRIALSASGTGTSIHLELEPLTPLAYHGQSGYAPQDADSRDASFYCSYTRLKTVGRILIDGKLEDVTGLSWMDHEKRTSSLTGPCDRLALQLSSGHDLLIYSHDGFVAGTWIQPGGEARHLIRSEIREDVVEYWISPATGARYPLKRRIFIEPLGLECEIRTTVPAQELDPGRSTLAAYWSGAVTASGRLGSAEIHGQGYLELDGYDHRARTRVAGFLIK
jgi:predicted secreted hydrolase